MDAAIDQFHKLLHLVIVRLRLADKPTNDVEDIAYPVIELGQHFLPSGRLATLGNCLVRQTGSRPTRAALGSPCGQRKRWKVGGVRDQPPSNNPVAYDRLGRQ